MNNIFFNQEDGTYLIETSGHMYTKQVTGLGYEVSFHQRSVRSLNSLDLASKYVKHPVGAAPKYLG